MKKTILLFIFAVATFAGIPRAISAEEPEVRPAEAVEQPEKKEGLFERLFKKRESEKQPETIPEPTATPPVKRAKAPEEAPTKKATVAEAPTKKAIATEASETVEETPTPKPKARKSKPKPAATPEEEETSAENPAKEATPKPKPTPEPTPEATPEPDATPSAEIDPSRLQEPLPFAPTPEPKVAATPAGPDILDPEYVEKTKERFEEVRTEALADENVTTLKNKADEAFEPAARAEALKTYYKALFDRMRKIEPSLKSRIDSREEVTLRRIESITPDGN